MFEEKLKEKLEIDRIKVLSAVYKKQADKLFIVLQYPNEIVLSGSQKQKIKAVCEEIVAPVCSNVSVSLKKAFIDLELVQSKVLHEVKASYPLISVFAEKNLTSKIENEKIFVSFVVEEGLQDYVKAKKVKESLEKKFVDVFSMPVEVSISFEKFEDEQEQEPEIVEAPEEFKPRFIKVFNKEKLVGEDIDEKPIYISDVKCESDRLVVCGIISHMQMREFTTKAGKVRNLLKLGLKDPTGELQCIMFVSEANKPKVEKLVDETEILVAGKCVQSKFSGGLELEIKEISLCQIEKNFVEEFHFKPEPATYKCVFPEKIEHVEQQSLFAVERKLSDYVKEHDVVVFDLETTGLNFMDSEIIEIGAIKIRKGGVISEKFSTFVKPSTKIPAEITQLTGITDEDVETGISLEDAIADFYKFTRGATLVGHNVSFDYGFIAYYGKKVGYDFSQNEMQDTYGLAAKNVKGLKNYKLKTVAEHFGVSLKNAHRAYHDAYATAEVYLKLHEMM